MRFQGLQQEAWHSPWDFQGYGPNVTIGNDFPMVRTRSGIAR
jgi:hypothetical protein